MSAVTVSWTWVKACRKLSTDLVAYADFPVGKLLYKSAYSVNSRPNSKKCNEYSVVDCVANRIAINAYLICGY